MVKYEHCFLPAVVYVPQVQLRSIELPQVRRVPSDDNLYPGIVTGHVPRKAVVLFSLCQRAGRHNKDTVSAHAGGQVHLGAIDHDAVRTPLHHAQVQVGIALLKGALASVALWIRNARADKEVSVLHILEPFHKSLVVIRVVFLINLKRCGVIRVGCIHNCAPLETASCLLPHEPLHLYLLEHILLRHQQVVKPVDFFSAQQMRCGRHQILILRLMRHLIGQLDTVGGGPQHRMIQRFNNPLTHVVNVPVLHCA